MDPFSSGVALPHRFTDEVNKVLVFTEVGEPEFLRFHGVLVFPEVDEAGFLHFHGFLCSQKWVSQNSLIFMGFCAHRGG